MKTTPSKRPASAASRSYRLSNSFPYLARRVGVRIGELFELTVAPLGVDVPTYRVLAVLHEQGDRRLSDLGTETGIPLPTLSRLIGTMIEQGLVTRDRPQSNGRIVEINLSPQGRTLVEALIPIAMRFEQAAMSGLGAAEVSQLKSQLERAFNNLDALEEEIRSGGELVQVAARIAGSRRERKRA